VAKDEEATEQKIGGMDDSCQGLAQMESMLLTYIFICVGYLRQLKICNTNLLSSSFVMEYCEYMWLYLNTWRL
jgi:hypothetical protein